MTTTNRYPSVQTPPQNNYSNTFADQEPTGLRFPTSATDYPLQPTGVDDPLWKNDSGIQWPHCPELVPLQWRRWWCKPCNTDDTPQKRLSHSKKVGHWNTLLGPNPYEPKVEFLERQIQLHNTQSGEALAQIWSDFRRLYPAWRTDAEQDAESLAVWSKRGDKLLLQLIEKDKISLEAVSRRLGRTAEVCASRYQTIRNVISEHRQGYRWDQQEEDALFEARAKHGGSWYRIAQVVDGRSEQACEEHFKFLMKDPAVRKAFEARLSRLKGAENPRPANTDARPGDTRSEDVNLDEWILYDREEDIEGSDPNVPEVTGSADTTIGGRPAAGVSSSTSLNPRSGINIPNAAGMRELRREGELVEGSTPRVDDYSTFAGFHPFGEPDLIKTAYYHAPLGGMSGAGGSSKGKGRARDAVPSATSGSGTARAGTSRTWAERDGSRSDTNELDNRSRGAKRGMQAPKSPARGQR
ncbi:hypothetical protein LTR09_000024 [Extremus antarcticus]|uniref:Myb-like domain-containing protein n=1 Tax=Extremus antarcticus TaxID=702011 RepID=A0AAJ0GIU9_9PEZI|nr:hypothetical protein LTR09_000024 [Extremus antarcticus]